LVLVVIAASIAGCGGGSSSSPSPSASPTLSDLNDDFESTFNTTRWATANGTPTIVADPVDKTNHVLQIDAKTAGKDVYCWSKTETLAPISLQLKARLTASGTLDIAFRAANSTKDCYGIQFFGGGSAYFYKCVGGNREYIGGTAGGSNNIANTKLATSTLVDNWKTLKLVATTDATTKAVTLSLYTDGNNTAPFATAAYADKVGSDTSAAGGDGAKGDPLTVGGVSIIAYNGATVLIDDVTVK
jgi:hypothetical protein